MKKYEKKIKPSKTSIITTLRIDREVMQRLRNESKSRDLSLNMLINQIFKNYVNWHAFESKISMIPLSKSVVSDIFKSLKKDEVIDIALNVAKQEIYNITLFMKSKVNEDSFMEWFESRIKNSSMYISHIVENDTHIYSVKHDICLNWSLHNKIILEEIFKEFIRKDIEIEIYEKAFVIRLEI